MRILLASDGSTSAAEAAGLAETIAWPADSQVRIVSVVEPGAWIPPLPRAPMTAAPFLEPELVAYLEERQAELLDRLALVGRAEAAILHGRPGTAIVDDARNFGADLVMVGSRGHGPIASLVLGSVSGEVVDHAPCPVLVARRGLVKRVVIATDGSPSARRAEDLVSGWPIFDGLPIDVVSVADATRPWTSGVAPMYQQDARDAYMEELQAAIETAERVASDAAARLREAGRDVETTIGRGDPAAEIINIADNRQADLIVLGSRGRSPLAEIVLGSVARNVLGGSATSVLIVREATAVDRRPEATGEAVR